MRLLILPDRMTVFPHDLAYRPEFNIMMAIQCGSETGHYAVRTDTLMEE
jgi:hypothetical protein